jgi:hypothetical protein
VVALWVVFGGTSCGGRVLSKDAATDRADTAGAAGGAGPDGGAGAPAVDAAPESPPPVDAASDVGLDAGSEALAPFVPSYRGTTIVGPTEGSGFQGYQDPSAAAFGADGALYVGGSFGGAIDFDPGPAADTRSPKGLCDGYVTKLNPDGSRAWTITLGGSGAYVRVTAIAVVAGAIAVAGYYNNDGVVDLDPGPAVVPGVTNEFGSDGGFVSRFSLDGKLLWAASFLYVQPLSVAIDAAGAVLAGGGYRGTSDFDPGPGIDQRTSVFEGGFLLKLTAGGGLAWARTYDGGICEGHINSVAVASNGDAWVAGTMADSSACVFGERMVSGETAKGGVIAAFSSGGQAKAAWKLARVALQAIAVSPEGAVFVGGAGSGSVDFDQGPGTAIRDLPEIDHFPTGFVLGLGPDGAFAWVQTRTDVSLRGLASVGTGVLALGVPRPSRVPQQGFLVERLDPAGGSLWSFRVGTDADLHAQTIAAGPSAFVVSGAAFDSDDFDPGPAMDLVVGRTTFFTRFGL